MLSVVIATHDSERLLLPTLAALVPGAAAGLVREVIVCDGGSIDDTLKIADIAGCNLLSSSAPRGQRLRDAAASARADWLLFLQPGVVLDPGWIEETGRFVTPANQGRAALFRPPTAGGRRALFLDTLSLMGAALIGRPQPQQALVIPKVLYETLGGHRPEEPRPQSALLRRLGRRSVVWLRTGATLVVP
jgi:glycosyltransferase involved in cell wall biosynthesis